MNFGLIKFDEIFDNIIIRDDMYDSDKINHIVDITRIVNYLNKYRGMNKSIVINKILYDYKIFDDDVLIVISSDIVEHGVALLKEVFLKLNDEKHFYIGNTIGNIIKEELYD